jgi:hypothetical protein
MSIAIDTAYRCAELNLTIDAFLSMPNETTYTSMMDCEQRLFDFALASGDETCLKMTSVTIERGLARIEAHDAQAH